jgi:pyruvoyl-dependent arginine decarboxylase (PvlArgDC)
MCPSPKSASELGGVSIPGTVGDIVGRDKIIHGLTEEHVEELTEELANQVVIALEANGFIQKAAKDALERQTIIKLAERLKPDDVLDFDQAVRELEHAVAVALDVIARGGARHEP